MSAKAELIVADMDGLKVDATTLHRQQLIKPLAELVEALTDEGLISMKDAAKLYGRKTNYATVRRHCLDGIVLPDGTRLHLEHIRLAGSIVTSKQAVIRFIAAQNETPPVSGQIRNRETPAQRTRAQAAASAEMGALLGAN
ncbi:hypothetical protein VT84_23350 [Gemmata sp. SH-PL17]|uniref:hypothetical protein n=1 Tax=Gemmata sp. SH-PL17 TaxID=1630693 RepID=UPI00078BE939|nr:hypothetical protein [Gemmata sp. SH-PL17]AMV27355.1 hypothetical protein VT84_23350 [Gemmata sp. SH-PL17]